MCDEKGKSGNPYVGHELCEAYRKALDTKIDSIKTIIVISVSISTTIISAVVWILKMQG